MEVPDKIWDELMRAIEVGVIGFLGLQFKKNRNSGEKRDSRVDLISDGQKNLQTEIQSLRADFDKLKNVIAKVGDRFGDKLESVKHDLHSVEMRVVKLEAMLIERKVVGPE